MRIPGPGDQAIGEFAIEDLKEPAFYLFDSVLVPLFAIHMLAPSKAMPAGAGPTGNVPSAAPSRARSLVTLLLPWFVTQMLLPSKATPTGFWPTMKVPWIDPSLAKIGRASCRERV